MSKATILASMQFSKDRLLAQRAKADTDIANLKTQIDEKKADKEALTIKIQQLTADMLEVQNSSIA